MTRAHPIGPFFAVLACASSIALAQERVRKIADIPDGIEIADEIYATSSPFSRREGNSLVSVGSQRTRSTLTFSADGTSVAYAGRRASGELVPVVGDEIGDAYDEVGTPRLAGGHAFFHVGRSKTESTESHWIWADGVEIGPEDTIVSFAVDDEGKRVAYWVHPGAKVGNAAQTTRLDQYLSLATRRGAHQWRVARSGKFRRASSTPPLFRADGRRVLSFGHNGKGFVVLERSRSRDRQRSDPFAQMMYLTASQDGDTVAMLVGDASGEEAPSVVVDGEKVGSAHRTTMLLQLDAAGEHVCYVAGEGTRSTVAVDTEATPAETYDHVLEVAFAPDASKIAFVANEGGRLTDWPPGVREGRFFAVVRPRVGDTAWRREGEHDDLRDLVWSPDGARLAYCARTEDRWHIVCGVEKSDGYDAVGPPVFTNGGRAIEFGARVGSELCWMRMQVE